MAERFYDLVFIDNSPLILNKLTGMFSSYPLSICPFTSAKKGFDHIVKHRPSVVIMNLSMSEITGDEVMIKLSEEKTYSETIVYLFTEKKLEGSRSMELMTLGFMNIFQFPIHDKEIESIIQLSFPNCIAKQAI